MAIRTGNSRTPGLERRLLLVLCVHATVILGGTTGYALIENMGWLDALYMAVITVTTVGFREVAPLSQGGKVFTIGLVVVGVGAFTYTFSTIADYFILGALGSLWTDRKMKKEISGLGEHYIVCGYGRVGYQVAEELKKIGSRVLVVDSNPDKAERAVREGHLAMVGDAQEDPLLIDAGVERAKGLVATLDADPTNMMTVLTARALNPELFIVARCNFENSENKLIKAGANRVITPYSISGRRMAHMAVRPSVVEYLDVVMHSGDLQLVMEELQVRVGSQLDGNTIAAAKIREQTGATVLGLKDRGGKLVVAPPPNHRIEADDMLLVLGTPDQLASLADLAQ